MILSVQCAVGNAGSKPVTQLKYPSGPFLGLVNTGKNQYGMNDGGIWQLNYTPSEGAATDDGVEILYSLRLNASNFGIPGNMKKIMYVYSVMTADANCMTAPDVTLKPDDLDEFTCGYNKKISREMMRTPVKCRRQGSYWIIGLDSNVPFTLFSMSANYIVRPMGVSNGC